MVKDREAWHVAVHRVTESNMSDQLNNNNKTMWKASIQMHEYKTVFSPLDFVMFLCIRVTLLSFAPGTSFYSEENQCFTVNQFLH